MIYMLHCVFAAMGFILMETFLRKETALPANLHSTVEYSHLERCQAQSSSSAYVELFIDSSGTAPI